MSVQIRKVCQLPPTPASAPQYGAPPPPQPTYNQAPPPPPPTSSYISKQRSRRQVYPQSSASNPISPQYSANNQQQAIVPNAPALSVEARACQNAVCPFWQQWGGWSPCSVTCGSGQITRNRQCSQPGQCVGGETEAQLCQLVQFEKCMRFI